MTFKWSDLFSLSSRQHLSAVFLVFMSCSVIWKWPMCCLTKCRAGLSEDSAFLLIFFWLAFLSCVYSMIGHRRWLTNITMLSRHRDSFNPSHPLFCNTPHLNIVFGKEMKCTTETLNSLRNERIKKYINTFSRNSLTRLDICQWCSVSANLLPFLTLYCNVTGYR